VEIGAVNIGSCKPQSCPKQKDNYSTGKGTEHYLPRQGECGENKPEEEKYEF